MSATLDRKQRTKSQGIKRDSLASQTASPNLGLWNERGFCVHGFGARRIDVTTVARSGVICATDDREVWIQMLQFEKAKEDGQVASENSRIYG
jgi:hypothetical protein